MMIQRLIILNELGPLDALLLYWHKKQTLLHC